MQTFVPYPNVVLSAASLDSKRLNKQLLEGRQIYQILAENRTKGGWVRHPAVLMWKNYDTGLYSYLAAIRDECNKRGIKWEKNWDAIQTLHDNNWHRGDKVVMPAWWKDERVHLSHRQNLYAKDPVAYYHFRDSAEQPKSHCCDKCNYWWPTHKLMYNDELIGYFKETA